MLKIWYKQDKRVNANDNRSVNIEMLRLQIQVMDHHEFNTRPSVVLIYVNDCCSLSNFFVKINRLLNTARFFQNCQIKKKIHIGLVRKKNFFWQVLSSLNRKCQGAESPTTWSVDLRYFSGSWKCECDLSFIWGIFI